MIRKTFRYLKPLWEGNDNQISLRSLAAMTLIGDFVYNIHSAVQAAVKVLNLIIESKPVDAASLSAMSANLGQVGVLLGIEAALIAALLGLKTYQNTVIGTTPCPIAIQDEVPPQPIPKVPIEHID